jgi:putative spermidine/putrescine transport system permease protein
MEKLMRRSSKQILFIISFLYLAYIFIPLLSASEYTFKTSVQGKYSLDNYRSVFEEPDFLHYVLRSFWLSALSVIITLLFQLPLQTWLHIKQSRLKSLVETISLLPLIIPVVAFAIGAQVAMPMFVQDSVLELPFLYAMLTLPYTYRAIDIGLSSVPLRTLYEAARISGGNWSQTITRAIIPNIRGAILASAALGFALCIGEFTLTSLLHWDTFPTWINDVSQDSVLQAITLSVISLIIPIVVISGFAMAFTREKRTS